jgi:hypothetical protein
VTPALRRATAAAGIGFVVLAGIESLDIMGAPGPDGPAAAVVEAYAGNDAKLLVTTVCGALSLVAYVLFACGLWRLVRDAGARGAWPALLLAAGIGGPLLGGTGQAAQFVLVARGTDGIRDDPEGALDLHAFDLRVQAAGALLIALLLLSAGVAGRRTGALPAWAALAALALAPLLAAAAVVALASDAAARGALVPVLALHALWVLAVAVHLLLGAWAPARDDPPAMTLARLMFGAVAVAAGLSGVALVAAPSTTADWFAWGLAPPPLAATVGGFYLASSAVYGLGARAGWRAGRVLAIGILALSAPIFVSTLVDLDVFDLGRLPAVTWVVLFGAFGPAALVVLVAQRRVGTGPEPDRPLGAAVRASLAVLALALLAAAVALWADPAGGASWLPYAPPPLSGRVLGTWAFMLATIAGWSAWRDRYGEAWPALLALVLFPAGALLGAARTAGDMDGDGRPAHLAVLGAWLAAALVVAWAARRAAAPAATASPPPRSSRTAPRTPRDPRTP